MRTLIYCTAYAGTATFWQARYRRWLDAILASGLQADQILLVDDGSPILPGWADCAISSGTVPGEAFTTPPRGRIQLFHFQQRLGRAGMLDFPGWHRSFTFGALYAQAQGFDRVIHIESDAFVISERARAYLNGFTDGWASFWSPQYEIPESAIQVVAGEGLRAFAEFARTPYAGMIGKPHETALPLTHVERSFTGDRYGEDERTIPEGVDYAAQVPSYMDPAYYWWQQGSAQPSPPQTALRLNFCAYGGDTSALGGGWAEPEFDYNWMIGVESAIRLPALPGEGEARLQLHVVPHIQPGLLSRQRLILELNGVRLEEYEVERDCIIGCAIPARLARARGQNMLRLIHPDAVSPNILIPGHVDARRLALSVRWLKLDRW